MRVTISGRSPSARSAIASGSPPSVGDDGAGQLDVAMAGVGERGGEIILRAFKRNRLDAAQRRLGAMFER